MIAERNENRMSDRLMPLIYDYFITTDVTKKLLLNLVEGELLVPIVFRFPNLEQKAKYCR